MSGRAIIEGIIQSMDAQRRSLLGELHSHPEHSDMIWKRLTSPATSMSFHVGDGSRIECTQRMEWKFDGETVSADDAERLITAASASGQ